MNFADNINDQIKEAMKARDQVKLRGLRAIKSAILLEMTKDGAAEGISEEQGIKICQKLVKQRKDSVEIFLKQERSDLAEKENEEIAVIESFLPAQLSKEELTVKVKAIIEKVGATSMKDMGKIMGIANQEFAGKADGKSISSVVKELLS